MPLTSLFFITLSVFQIPTKLRVTHLRSNFFTYPDLEKLRFPIHTSEFGEVLHRARSLFTHFEFFPLTRAFSAPPIVLLPCMALFLTSAFSLPSLLIITVKYINSFTTSSFQLKHLLFSDSSSFKNKNVAATYIYFQHLPLTHIKAI